MVLKSKKNSPLRNRIDNRRSGKKAIAKPALLIVGLHSSGKSTLSQALASTGPYWIFELGDGVREEARKRRESNLVRVASGILSGNDPILLARAAIKRARAMNDRVPIFVGARTAQERDHLKTAYPSLLVIGLSTHDSIRRERWRTRQMLATDKWIEREKWESRWETRSLVQQAELRLIGTESILNMCKKISSAIKKEWGSTYV
jgi:adenylate kinase family enzyme